MEYYPIVFGLLTIMLIHMPVNTSKIEVKMKMSFSPKVEAINPPANGPKVFPRKVALVVTPKAFPRSLGEVERVIIVLAIGKMPP